MLRLSADPPWLASRFCQADVTRWPGSVMFLYFARLWVMMRSSVVRSRVDTASLLLA